MSTMKLHRQIFLACCLVLTAFCVLVSAQGGTGKLPPLRPPIRNPPRRDPDPIQVPQSRFVFSVDSALLRSGIVGGVVTWRGPAPKRWRIDTSADPVCAPFIMEEPVVRASRLANVFVYVKEGVTEDGKKLSDLSFPLPEREVVIDQKGCVFVPRVIGVMVGQTVSVKNSDPTTHNVHFITKRNADSNASHGPGGAPITRRFEAPEIMALLKCNQHPWMKTYVGVLTHPFFAVTGEDGKYEIRGLPPGKYTLAVWHESGGGTELTRKITVLGPR